MTEDKTITGNLYGVPVTATFKGNPYTPTTEQVRKKFPSKPECWVFDGDEWIPEFTKDGFDRWLAEVKAQAKAEALEKVANDLASMAGWNAQEAETILLAQKRIRALSQTFLDGENSE